jgi:hypothetical protein
MKIPWKPLVMVALHRRGGSSTLHEIYSDFQAGVFIPLPDNLIAKKYTQAKFTRHIRPALTYLRNRGLTENPKRGFWKLSAGGHLEVAHMQARVSQTHPQMSSVPLHLLIEALTPFEESI